MTAFIRAPIAALKLVKVLQGHGVIFLIRGIIPAFPYFLKESWISG